MLNLNLINMYKLLVLYGRASNNVSFSSVFVVCGLRSQLFVHNETYDDQIWSNSDVYVNVNNKKTTYYNCHLMLNNIDKTIIILKNTMPNE